LKDTEALNCYCRQYSQYEYMLSIPSKAENSMHKRNVNQTEIQATAHPTDLNEQLTTV